MRLDDLFGDRQPEAGMVAELAWWPFGIEAFENLGQRFVRDAWAGILDHDQHPDFSLARPNPHRVTLGAK